MGYTMAETELKGEKMDQDVQQPADTHVMSAEEKARADISRSEWENPMNWGGPGNTAVYFSKRDKRIWVPKHAPGAGWTVNLAHTGGILWLVGLCMGMILVLALAASWVFSDQIVRILM